jgi:uncharacterized protein (DUF488 family)
MERVGMRRELSTVRESLDRSGRLLSVGHGTADRAALTRLFQDAEARQVVDVRRYPGSRRNPDVATDAMAQWLPEVEIAYRWDPRLGGRRRVPVEQDPDLDRWWRVEAFRAYAAHVRTAEFAAALGDLVASVPAPGSTLFMCSESLWWRCHRRLISDAAVLLHGVDVHHLGHDGRVTQHQVSAGARLTSEGIVYDAQPPPA